MNKMTNSEILEYFQEIAAWHVVDTISISQQGAENDEEKNAWKTKTDHMGRLVFRSSDDDFDGLEIRNMMRETGLNEAQVRLLLDRAVAEAFDCEINRRADDAASEVAT